MLGRIVFVLMLLVAVALVPAVSFAGGGVAVAVPSCHANNVQAVQVQAVQTYAAPVQVAVRSTQTCRRFKCKPFKPSRSNGCKWSTRISTPFACKS